MNREKSKSLALMVFAGVLTAAATAFLFDALARARDRESQNIRIPDPIAPGQGSV